MKKIAKILASFAALAFVVAPAVPANAYSEGVAPQDGVITVSTEDDLKEAIADTKKSERKVSFWRALDKFVLFSSKKR